MLGKFVLLMIFTALLFKVSWETSASADPVCHTHKCKDYDDKTKICLYSDTSASEQYTKSYTCRTSDYCGLPDPDFTQTSDLSQLICMIRVEVGGPCISQSACQDGLYCYQGHCHTLRKQEGEICFGDEDCDSRLNCRNNVCSTWLEEEDYCEGDDECGSKYVCSRLTHSCVAMMSKAEDEEIHEYDSVSICETLARYSISASGSVKKYYCVRAPQIDGADDYGRKACTDESVLSDCVYSFKNRAAAPWMEADTFFESDLTQAEDDLIGLEMLNGLCDCPLYGSKDFKYCQLGGGEELFYQGPLNEVNSLSIYYIYSWRIIMQRILIVLMEMKSAAISFWKTREPTSRTELLL